MWFAGMSKFDSNLMKYTLVSVLLCYKAFIVELTFCITKLNPVISYDERKNKQSQLFSVRIFNSIQSFICPFIFTCVKLKKRLAILHGVLYDLDSCPLTSLIACPIYTSKLSQNKNFRQCLLLLKLLA